MPQLLINPIMYLDRVHMGFSYVSESTENVWVLNWETPALFLGLIQSCSHIYQDTDDCKLVRVSTELTSKVCFSDKKVNGGLISITQNLIHAGLLSLI